MYLSFFCLFLGVKLQNANFDGSTLEKARFTSANCTNASFRRANCYEARFIKTRLTNSIFTESNLLWCKFKSSKGMVSFDSFTGADVGYADFERSSITSQHLVNARNVKSATKIPKPRPPRSARFSKQTSIGSDTSEAFSETVSESTPNTFVPVHDEHKYDTNLSTKDNKNSNVGKHVSSTVPNSRSTSPSMSAQFQSKIQQQMNFKNKSNGTRGKKHRTRSFGMKETFESLSLDDSSGSYSDDHKNNTVQKPKVKPENVNLNGSGRKKFFIDNQY